MPPKTSKSTAPRPKKKQRPRTSPLSTDRSPPSSPPLVHPPSPPPAPPQSTTHIRPPPLSYGNPSIHSLLLDNTAITRYQSFKDRPFVQIHSLTREFVDSLHIGPLHDMLSCQPMTNFLLDNHDHIFPGMVGQFFANLCFENNNSNILVSRVNRVTIRLDWQLLNAIFGTTLADSDSTLYYWDTTHLWPQTSDKFRISELRTMFKVTSREAKDFNPSNLAPADRVVYHVLVNFVNPVAGHFTNPGRVPLVYYYLFTHQTPIDWGFVVFNRLCDIVTDHRRNLPHAQFLTPVFRHFKVPFTEAGIAPHPFDISTLNKKGIRLYQGQWITRTEYLSMTKPSTSSHPPSSPPLAPSSAYACLAASVQSLEHTMHHLINHVRYLEHGVKMSLPAERQEEYESDSILFDIPWSTPSDDPPVTNVSASVFPEQDASTDSDLASHASDDEPLIRRFQPSRP